MVLLGLFACMSTHEDGSKWDILVRLYIDGSTRSCGECAAYACDTADWVEIKGRNAPNDEAKPYVFAELEYNGKI